MDASTGGLTTQSLSLPEELILMLLNEETGYFHQVHGWELNCAVVGAVLAELSLLERIDTDMESLLLVDRTETGDPILDSILKEIAGEPSQHNAQYWVERLAVHAESIIDSTLDRLVDLKILKHHDGEFWTLTSIQMHSDVYGGSLEDTADQFIKTRISKFIYASVIPDPRDMIIICLVNTCDVFRFIFDLDEEAEERIKFICKMDLIGRSIAAAVEHNIASPMLRRSALGQENSARPVDSDVAQPAFTQRQSSGASWRSHQDLRPGVRGSSAVHATHGFSFRAGGKSLGSSARTNVSQSQGLF